MKLGIKQQITILFLHLVFSSFAQTIPVNYKAVYRLTYIPELITKKAKMELVSLIIDQNQQSLYATENLFKQDSIKVLVRENKLSPQEVMTDKYPKTGFKNYIQKQYATSNIQVFDKIGLESYVYNQKNTLIWQILIDTLTVSKYHCQKATTTYEGRDYVAWFTSEIPISDGPYKFWGLPGLIVKINDKENHYEFVLEKFEKHIGKKDVIVRTKAPIEISYDKFKALNKEAAENPLKSLEDMGLKVTGANGQNPSTMIKQKKQNPIERY